MAKESYKGEVKAPVIPMRFAKGGRVSWCKVQKGDTVKKGQALAGLDSRELEIQHKIELADYQRVRAEFDKTSRQIPEAKTDDEKTEKQIAQAKLDKAVKSVEKTQLGLDEMTLLSPVNGIVIEDSDLRAGMRISPASFEIEIADMDQVVVETEIELEVIRENKLSKGSKAKLILGGQEMETEIIWMDNMAEKGNLEVLFKIPEGLEYVLGEKGEIELVVES